MPSQHHKDKEYIGAFVYKKVNKSLLSMAGDHNVGKSDVIKASLLKFNELTKKEQGSALAKVID